MSDEITLTVRHKGTGFVLQGILRVTPREVGESALWFGTLVTVSHCCHNSASHHARFLCKSRPACRRQLARIRFQAWGGHCRGWKRSRALSFDHSPFHHSATPQVPIPLQLRRVVTSQDRASVWGAGELHGQGGCARHWPRGEGRLPTSLPCQVSKGSKAPRDPESSGTRSDAGALKHLGK